MHDNTEMMNIRVERFKTSQEKEWDDFIVNKAYNGAFVATRNFLNYHPPERFIDYSLMLKKDDKLIAVVPACEITDNGKRIFFSHRGSTFGGIMVSRDFFEARNLSDIIDALEKYLKEKSFNEVVLKQVPGVFGEGSTGLLDYLLGLKGFGKFEELSFIISLKELTKDILDSFRLQTRQQVVQGKNFGLLVKEISLPATVTHFHQLLSKNLAKHGAKPVHSVEELLDLKKRFPKSIHFYGCFLKDRMIGGTFMWQYGDRVFHEQNMATDEEFAHLRPANVLNYAMIEEAVRRGVPYFSFGISTEDHGKKLNFGLARFKEGFGARGFINTTYHKTYE